MSGKILIVDDVATSRIVLKVQLSASFYNIVVAESGARAIELARREQPDIVILADTLADMPVADLLGALRTHPSTAWSTLIVNCQSFDRIRRARLLSAGADDIFARGQPEVLLLSRLRSLLRARGTEDELRMREGTLRGLGIEEPAPAFEAPGRVTLVTRRSATSLDWYNALSRMTRHRYLPQPIAEALRWTHTTEPADVFVIDLDGNDKKSVLRLVADIRSRSDVRHAEVLLVTADHHHPVLADALDLGASAAMSHGFDPRETLLRLDALIRRKRNVERLRRSLEDGLRASVTDPLTGLYNRRYVMPHLERLLSGAHEGRRRFAVVLADLDHFKSVNDRFGHNAGDVVLLAVADLLRDNLRARDLVARFGGEEFLIVMPDTGRAEAELVAERLRKRLEEMPIPLPDRAERLFATMSMGICVATPAPDQSPERAATATIDRADRALYAAKNAGRNTVVMAEDD